MKGLRAFKRLDIMDEVRRRYNLIATMRWTNGQSIECIFLLNQKSIVCSSRALPCCTKHPCAPASYSSLVPFRRRHPVTANTTKARGSSATEGIVLCQPLRMAAVAVVGGMLQRKDCWGRQHHLPHPRQPQQGRSGGGKGLPTKESADTTIAVPAVALEE